MTPATLCTPALTDVQSPVATQMSVATESNDATLSVMLLSRRRERLVAFSDGRFQQRPIDDFQMPPISEGDGATVGELPERSAHRLRRDPQICSNVRTRDRQIYLFSNFSLRSLQCLKKLYKQSNSGNCAVFAQQERMMLSLSQIVAKFANDFKVQLCILPQPCF